jgi:hypothetical protein
VVLLFESTVACTYGFVTFLVRSVSLSFGSGGPLFCVREQFMEFGIVAFHGSVCATRDGEDIFEHLVVSLFLATASLG